MRHPRISLRPHQLTLLARCRDIECREQEYEGHKFKTTVGIIGDKVGSGKSYAILALVYTTLSESFPDTVAFRSVGMDHVMLRATSTAAPVNACVLVVPHNLTGQWEAYIEAFGQLRALVVKRRPTLAKLVDVGQYDLIVVTSTLYNAFADAHPNTRFKRVIFDEADGLSIPNCASLTASFTWFVTASYNNLVYPRGFTERDPDTSQYRLLSVGLKNKGYINNLFTDLFFTMSPKFTPHLIAINRDEFVDQSFLLPAVREHRVACRSSNVISVLNGVVAPEIIACLNAEDVASALAHVSAHNRSSEDNIVRVVLDRFHRQAHNVVLQRECAARFEYESEEQRVKEMGELAARHDDLERKIRHIERRIRDTDMCSICLNDIEHKTVTAECCQNSFCFKCITQWVNVRPVCPCCKGTVRMDDLYVIQEGASACTQSTPKAEPELGERNDKLANFRLLLARLRATPGSKTLVFSAYDESFGQLSLVMSDAGLEYKYIRGSGAHINKVVDEYKNGAVDFLFVNAQNYGSGLNLENTTDIVIFHQFNPEITKQVIGRAQRMGRTAPLNVWYLLNDNELVAAAAMAGA